MSCMQMEVRRSTTTPGGIGRTDKVWRRNVRTCSQVTPDPTPFSAPTCERDAHICLQFPRTTNTITLSSYKLGSIYTTPQLIKQGLNLYTFLRPSIIINVTCMHVSVPSSNQSRHTVFRKEKLWCNRPLLFLFVCHPYPTNPSYNQQ